MAQWHCSVNGQKFGPVETEVLLAWIKEGRVKPADMVWTDGLSTWVQAQQVTELFATPLDADVPMQSLNTNRRPGGLTTLAILNFVFGGFGLLSNLINLATGKNSNEVPEESRDVLVNLFGGGGSMPSDPVMFALTLSGIVACAFLIASGIGYLQQKKVLGYWMGNVYGILGVVQSAITIIIFSPALGWMALLIALFSLAYPVITLCLLNLRYSKRFS